MVRFIFRVNGCTFVTQRAENRCAKPLVRPWSIKWNVSTPQLIHSDRNDRFLRNLDDCSRERVNQRRIKYQFFEIDSKMNKFHQVYEQTNKARYKIFPRNFPNSREWTFDDFIEFFSRFFFFFHRFASFSDSSDSWGSTNRGNSAQRDSSRNKRGNEISIDRFSRPTTAKRISRQFGLMAPTVESIIIQHLIIILPFGRDTRARDRKLYATPPWYRRVSYRIGR